MGIRQGTRTAHQGVVPKRVVVRHASRPQCVTAAVGCTAAPVRARVLQRVWRDRGARAGSMGCILQKAKRNKNGYVSSSNRVESY